MELRTGQAMFCSIEREFQRLEREEIFLEREFRRVERESQRLACEEIFLEPEFQRVEREFQRLEREEIFLEHEFRRVAGEFQRLGREESYLGRESKRVACELQKALARLAHRRAVRVPPWKNRRRIAPYHPVAKLHLAMPFWSKLRFGGGNGRRADTENEPSTERKLAIPALVWRVNQS